MKKVQIWSMDMTSYKQDIINMKWMCWFMVTMCVQAVVVGQELERYESHWMWDLVEVWKEVNNNTMLVFMDY